MSLLLRFPNDIVFYLFSEWLHSHEMMNIDSAFCNTIQREEFLSWLNDERFVIYTSTSTSCATWICLRELKLRCLKMRSVMLSYFSHDIIPKELNRTRLTTIYLGASDYLLYIYELEFATSTIQSCFKLENIYLHARIERPLLSHPTLWSWIVHLTYANFLLHMDNKNQIEEFLTFLSIHCTKMTTLLLRF